MNEYTFTDENLSLNDIANISKNKLMLSLTEERKAVIRRCRSYLERKIFDEDGVYYGVNTGFGSLCNVKIESDRIEELQINLVRSHAAGTGDRIPETVARCILFLKIQNLSLGYSGVREELVDHMIEVYNAGITPVIYELGSLGASGDLAPLAHMSLLLMGEGEAIYEGKKQVSADILNQVGISPLKLKAKEGLALLNGTQFSTAYASICLLKSRKLMKLAQLNAAMSLYAFNCRTEPYNSTIHRLRRQKGQITIARNILSWLEGGDLNSRKGKDVQDPYAFRCIPQVLGATLDALSYAETITEREINAVTDNPTILADEDRIISGGNFHAQPIGLILDQIAIAMSEVGSIAERRIFQLTTGKRQLPAYLTARPGLNSGMMIPQYTAAAIVSQNKQLSTPASVDSITSSLGQEDHVSMSANAATKLWKVVDNIAEILSIEFMINAQAFEFVDSEMKPPRLIEIVHDYRDVVKRLENDRIMYRDMKKTRQFLTKMNYM